MDAAANPQDRISDPFFGTDQGGHHESSADHGRARSTVHFEMIIDMPKERMSERVFETIMHDIEKVVQNMDVCTEKLDICCQTKGMQQDDLQSTFSGHRRLPATQIQKQIVEVMQFTPQEQIVGMLFSQLQAAVESTRACRKF